MADKIRKEDVFAKDIFDTKDIEKYRLSLDALVISTETLIKKNVDLAQNNPMKSASDIREFNRAINEGTKSIELNTRARKADVSLQIEEEKLKQQAIKTAQAQASADSKRAKDIERQNKLIKEQNDHFLQSRKRLKELTSELLNLKPGTQRFKEIAAEAGKLKDQMNDAKDAVKAFANESKAATAKTLFGQVLDDIKNLDFKGAADKAKILSDVIRGIDVNEVVSGFKNLGSTLLDLGKAVFLNPLTAILGIVTAVGIAVYTLYENFTFVDDAAKDFNKTLDEQKKKLQDIQEETLKLKLQNDQLSGKISEKDAKTLIAKEEFKKKYIAILEEQRKREDEIRGKFDGKIQSEKDVLRAGGGTVVDIVALEKERDRELLQVEKDRQEQLKALQENYGEQLRAINIVQHKKEVEQKKQNSKEIVRLKQEEILAIQKIDLLNQVRDIDSELDASIKRTKIRQNEEDYKRKLAEESARLRREARKKEIAEEIATAQKVLGAIEDGVQQRRNIEEKAFDESIDSRKRAIDQQFQLAAQGKYNELAFQQAQLKKEEQARKENDKRRQRQEQAIKLSETFLSDLNSKLEKDIPFSKAVSQALAETFAAKGLSSLIAGSAYDGTEDTGDRGKVDNKGGKLWVLHPNERVLTKKQNEMIGDMSNDDLARLALSHRLLPDSAMPEAGSFAKNVADSLALNTLKSMNDKMELLKDIAEKPVPHWEVDKIGNVIHTLVSKGVTTRIKHMNKHRGRL